MATLDRKDTFQFKGFIPTQILKEKCSCIYENVENYSPSEAIKEARLVKYNQAYIGELKITSASCIFTITSQEDDPIVSVDKLYRKFRKKMLVWNQQRTLSP